MPTASRACCRRSSQDPPGWPDRGHVEASGSAPRPCDWASGHTSPGHVGLPSAPAPPRACLWGQGLAGSSEGQAVAAAGAGCGCRAPPGSTTQAQEREREGEGPWLLPAKAQSQARNLIFTCGETVFGFFFNLRFLITNSNLRSLAVQSPEGLAAPLETGGPRPAAGHREGHGVARQSRTRPL